MATVREIILALCFGVASISLASCSKDGTLPEVRTSYALGTDGSNFVPLSGTPDDLKAIAIADSARTGRLTTSPVPLATGGFVVGTEKGLLVVVSANDSLQRTITTRHDVAVSQLLVRGSRWYAIFADNAVVAIGMDGSSLWESRIDTTITGPATLWGEQLVVPTAAGVFAYELGTGRRAWRAGSGKEASSVVVRDAANELLAAVTAGMFGVRDSVLRIAKDGKLVGAIELSGRITSNLALCGRDHQTLACGVSRGMGGTKQPGLDVLDLASGKSQFRHDLPYFVNAVGANDESLITSGFRDVGGEVVSGIDAFALADTTHRWARRFTEPMLMPVGVGEGTLYFTLAFESQAIVESRGLLYALSATNGKTLYEHALPGAIEGFVAGIPMPDDAGRLLISDRAKCVVHVIDRSVFHRLF